MSNTDEAEVPVALCQPDFSEPKIKALLASMANQITAQVIAALSSAPTYDRAQASSSPSPVTAVTSQPITPSSQQICEGIEGYWDVDKTIDVTDLKTWNASLKKKYK